MTVSRTRIRAIFRKELSEYRRNRQIVVSMVLLPAVFAIFPLVQIFALPAAASAGLTHKLPLVYMLAIPAIVPATLAAYSVAGERQQGTLEPVLTTPVRAGEFLLGKALAVLFPTLLVAYLVVGAFTVAIELFGHPAVAAAIVTGPQVLVQVVFTPLVAAFCIWAGIGVSARSTDPRVATQLSILVSAPLIAFTTAVSLGGIRLNLAATLVLGAALLLLDGAGWWVVSPLLDRERLIADTKA